MQEMKEGGQRRTIGPKAQVYAQVTQLTLAKFLAHTWPTGWTQRERKYSNVGKIFDVEKKGRKFV